MDESIQLSMLGRTISTLYNNPPISLISLTLCVMIGFGHANAMQWSSTQENFSPKAHSIEKYRLRLARLLNKGLRKRWDPGYIALETLALLRSASDFAEPSFDNPYDEAEAKLFHALLHIINTCALFANDDEPRESLALALAQVNFRIWFEKEDEENHPLDMTFLDTLKAEVAVFPALGEVLEHFRTSSTTRPWALRRSDTAEVSAQNVRGMLEYWVQWTMSWEGVQLLFEQLYELAREQEKRLLNRPSHGLHDTAAAGDESGLTDAPNYALSLEGKPGQRVQKARSESAGDDDDLVRIAFASVTYCSNRSGHAMYKFGYGWPFMIGRWRDILRAVIEMAKEEADET
jgi:hypothetical protein